MEFWRRSVEGMGRIDAKFWHKKRVLVTGHTGFKGTWLTSWLCDVDAEVLGIALPPAQPPNLFAEWTPHESLDSRYVDIRERSLVKEQVGQFRPEIVFHLAAQPLVLKSLGDAYLTFDTNVMGTLNVLEACREAGSVRAFLNITTDKVYRSSPHSHSEEAPLGANDPYSTSKACADLIGSCYRQSFFDLEKVGVANLRAGNVIGGGDWGENRLISDLMKSWASETATVIRSPSSVRPWQHVLCALHGYMLLAQALYQNPQKFSGEWNFGPEQDDHICVGDLIALINERLAFHSRAPLKVTDATNESSVEAHELRISSAKARSELAWSPRWNIHKAVEATVDWYVKHRDGTDVNSLLENQLQQYRSPMESSL